MQDYGGPVGFRIITRHPEWLEWLILQNTNAYEIGFTSAWDGLRNALWKNRTPETEAPLYGFFKIDTIKKSISMVTRTLQPSVPITGTWILVS